MHEHMHPWSNSWLGVITSKPSLNAVATLDQQSTAPNAKSVAWRSFTPGTLFIVSPTIPQLLISS